MDPNASNAPGQDPEATTPDPDAVEGETSQDGEPDYQQLYEKSQETSNLLEQRVGKAEAAANARMQTLEKLVIDRFNSTPAAPPEPEPIQQLTDEQVENMTPAQMIQYADYIAEKKAERYVQANNRRMAGALKGVFDHQFSSTLDAIKARDNELYEIVQEEFESHFEKNPSDKYVPGRAQAKFDELVGKNFTKIKEKIAKATKVTTPPIVPGSPRPASPGSPIVQDQPSTVLNAEEARIAAKFGMDEAKYIAWKKMEDPELIPDRRN